MATLITADGAYHCPVGSIMAIFVVDMEIWKWTPKDTFEYLQLTLSSHKLTLVNSQCSGPLPPVARLKRDEIIKAQEHKTKTEINPALTLFGQLTIFSLDQ